MSLATVSPAEFAALGRLDLIARLVVEGFLVGLHRSPFHGFSSEFAEYRACFPGEPVTHVDWRVYAKSDRLYRKVFSEETNLRATLLVDCSASMGYGSDAARPTKLAYARLLAASLARLLLRQNDAVGLELFDSRRLGSVPARAVRRQLFEILKHLDDLPAGRGTALGPVLHEVAERLPRRGLVVLISDLMDSPAEVADGLRHFRHRGHEVIVFQVLDPRELDLDFKGEARFRDLERPDRTLRLEPAHARAAYRERFEAWRGEVRGACRRERIDLVETSTDTPFDRALLAYLSKRRRLA